MITSTVTVSGKDRHNFSIRKFLADSVHRMHPSARTSTEQLEQSLGKRQNGIIETSLHTLFCTYIFVLIVFALAPSLHSFWSYFSTDLQLAYWAPTDLGSFSFSILSFYLFILFMGFSRQEYWSGLPFPSPVDHILSDLSTMTRPSWVAPRAWLSFTELEKAMVVVWLD